MEPDQIMDGITTELKNALKSMSKAKDINEKEAYSRIVKNLSDSLGVFLGLAAEMMGYDEDGEYYDDGDDEYDDEDEDIPF